MKNVDIHGKTYRPVLLVIVLLIGTFCTVLNQTILATAFPTLMKYFDISTSTVQWLSTGFLLVNGIMIPISAWLTTRIPSKKLYISAMLFFLVGTFIAFKADTFSALLTGRLVQAVGVGIAMPLLQTMMLSIFPMEKRGASMGLAGLVVGLAPAIGPTLSGYIIDHYRWQTLFGMILPIVIVVIIASFFFMRDVIPTKKTSVDVLSVILSTLGFGGLLYGFSSVGDNGWLDTTVLASLIIGIVFVALFSYRQLHMETPFLDLRVFKVKEFLLSAIMVAVVMMAMIGAEMIIPMYLQTVRGESAFHSGLTLLPGAMMMGIMSLFTGRIFDKKGAKYLAIGGLTLLTLSTAPFMFLTSDTPKIYVTVLYAVRMFGIAMVMMPVTTTGMNALPAESISHGTAVNNTVRQVASSMGTAVLISVLSNVTKDNMPGKGLLKAAPLAYKQQAIDATLKGYHMTFAIATGVALVSVFLAFLVKNKKRSVGGAAK